MGVAKAVLTRIRLVFLWVLEESHFVVTALTALTILYTRSSAIAFFAAGAVVCSRIVKLMKLVLRQPRPVNPLPGKQKIDYGMPSTHSGVISFYIGYTLLASRYLPLHRSLPQSPLTRIVAPLIIVPWAISVMASRIWLGHHTWPQVSVGCSIGLAFSPVWFWLWAHVGQTYGNYYEQLFF